MKRKLYKGEWMLLFLFLVISIASICFTFYMVKSYHVEMLSQGFYSNNAQHIKVDNDKELFPSLMSIKNGSIYIETSNKNFDTRYVVVEGDTYVPPIKSGRFFTNSDFMENKAVAVVGKNILPYCNSDSSSKSLFINGKTYEVIGVMGDNIASKLDNTCFLSLSAQDELPGKIIIVDSNRKKNIDSICDQILSAVGEDSFEKLNIATKSISNWMNMEINSLSFYIMILLLFILNSVVLTGYWLEKRIKHIAIMRLCGYSNLRIVAFIINRYIRCLLGGYIAGFILITPFILLNNNYAFSSVTLIVFLTFIVVLICGLLIAAFPAYRACKMNVNTLLRRAEKNEV